MLKRIDDKEAWKLLEKVFDGEFSKEEFLDRSSVINSDIDWEFFVSTDGGFPIYSITATQDESFELKVSVMRDGNKGGMWEQCYKIPNELIPYLDETMCELEYAIEPVRNFEDFTYGGDIFDKVHYNHEDMVSYLLRQNVLFVNSRKYIDGRSVLPETLTLFVIVSDTFAYACADAEEISLKDLPIVCEKYCKYGYSGIANWAAKKRGIKPIKPIQERMKKAGCWDDEMEALPYLRKDIYKNCSDGEKELVRFVQGNQELSPIEIEKSFSKGNKEARVALQSLVHKGILELTNEKKIKIKKHYS